MSLSLPPRHGRPLLALSGPPLCLFTVAPPPCCPRTAPPHAGHSATGNDARHQNKQEKKRRRVLRGAVAYTSRLASPPHHTHTPRQREGCVLPTPRARRSLAARPLQLHCVEHRRGIRSRGTFSRISAPPPPSPGLHTPPTPFPPSHQSVTEAARSAHHSHSYTAVASAPPSAFLSLRLCVRGKLDHRSTQQDGVVQ